MYATDMGVIADYLYPSSFRPRCDIDPYLDIPNALLLVAHKIALGSFPYAMGCIDTAAQDISKSLKFTYKGKHYQSGREKNHYQHR